LRSDGAQTRIAAFGPPYPGHDGDDDERQAERPIAAKKKSDPIGGGWGLYGAFVERDGDGDAFVIGEGSGGVDLHTVAGGFNEGIAGARAVGTGVDVGANILCRSGKRNAGGCGADGDSPFVASDIPIKLVMIIKKSEGVGNRVFDDDGLNGIVGIVDIDFEFAVLALAGGIVLHGLVSAVGDAVHGQEERVVHSLRGDIFDGNFAVQAVPGAADEICGDGFGDADGTVGKDSDLGVEFFDAQLFGGCGGGEAKEVEKAKNVQERTQRDAS